jgi:hypothetical protein
MVLAHNALANTLDDHRAASRPAKDAQPGGLELVYDAG